MYKTKELLMACNVLFQCSFYKTEQTGGQRMGAFQFLTAIPTIKKRKNRPKAVLSFLAGGEGFEPPLAESESAVLPLDEPPNILFQTNPQETWVELNVWSTG